MRLSIPNAVTTRVARSILVTQKHSPTLLFVGGVVGVVATTVTACRATLKLEEVLEKAEADKVRAKMALDLGRTDYTEKDYKREVIALTVKHATQVGQLYAPTIVLGTLSIAALTRSHTLLTRRNASLSAAYAAVDKAFKQYRTRVVDELGEEKDKEFRYGVVEETVTVEDKNGPKKKKVKKIGDGGGSMYSRLFDESNKNWHVVPEYNVMFLRGVQTMANDRLHAKGYVMLCDVYDDLGLERTTASQVVGWVKGNGDSYIDFGIWDPKNSQMFSDFVTGREGSIWIDFNVDGEVHRLLDKIGGRNA